MVKKSRRDFAVFWSTRVLHLILIPICRPWRDSNPTAFDSPTNMSSLAGFYQYAVPCGTGAQLHLTLLPRQGRHIGRTPQGLNQKRSQKMEPFSQSTGEQT